MKLLCCVYKLLGPKKKVDGFFGKQEKHYYFVICKVAVQTNKANRSDNKYEWFYGEETAGLIKANRARVLMRLANNKTQKKGNKKQIMPNALTCCEILISKRTAQQRKKSHSQQNNNIAQCV